MDVWKENLILIMVWVDELPNHRRLHGINRPSMQSRWKNDQNSFLIEKTVLIQLVFVFEEMGEGIF